MSNELIVPAISFMPESASVATHVNTHPAAKEATPPAKLPFSPKVFKGAGHTKIEQELANVLSQLPYTQKPLATPKVKTKTKFQLKDAVSVGFGAVYSIVSPQVTVGGAAFTAATTAVKYAYNKDGIIATRSATRQIEQVTAGSKLLHSPDHERQPDPMALMGRTRLLRSRQNNQRGLKNQTTIPLDAPESHVMKITANSNSNGQSRE